MKAEDNLYKILSLELKKLTAGFNKISNIPKPSLGNVVPVPQIYSIDTTDRILAGNIKDTMFRKEDIKTKTVKIPIGYVFSSRAAKKEFDVSLCLPLLIYAIKVLEKKIGFSPTAYHYGDFIEIVDVTEAANQAGYTVEFKGNAIPIMRDLEKRLDKPPKV